MLILHDPNSKESRDFIEANPDYPVKIFDASMRTEYLSIAGFPAVILWDGSIVSMPETLEAALAQSRPDRAKFHSLSSGSQLWGHISAHTPELAALLYTAMGLPETFDQVAVLSNMKDMMRGIVAQLGNDHALHSTQSLTMVSDPNDPEGLPIPVGTLADELSQILSDSFFPFTYADLLPTP